MLEKESSGMYFSGHMLDNYSKHVEALDVITTAELCEKSDDGELVYSDKDRVRLVGIITSVSLKTTKNDDRMAFFTLEDKFGEVECIVFPKKYSEFYHEIFVDGALYVEGTVSIKDDDEPKILINHLSPLEDNERFVNKSSVSKKVNESSKVLDSQVPQDTSPMPQGAPNMINMYLSMYEMGGGNTASQSAPRVSALKDSAPASRVSASARTNASDVVPMPKKIYLRVPNMSGEIFKKAKNMVDIFNEGTVAVIFYDSSTAKYSEYSERMFCSEYAVKELKKIVGDDNVVIK